ncbi:hypothetical protein OG21DRAFT_210843 [Imleria badia]|nr:hypothetical protein OG21DRAFT_210843 [Imleria badia]
MTVRISKITDNRQPESQRHIALFFRLVLCCCCYYYYYYFLLQFLPLTRIPPSGRTKREIFMGSLYQIYPVPSKELASHRWWPCGVKDKPHAAAANEYSDSEISYTIFAGAS